MIATDQDRAIALRPPSGRTDVQLKLCTRLLKLSPQVGSNMPLSLAISSGLVKPPMSGEPSQQMLTPFASASALHPDEFAKQNRFFIQVAPTLIDLLSKMRLPMTMIMSTRQMQLACKTMMPKTLQLTLQLMLQLMRKSPLTLQLMQQLKLQLMSKLQHQLCNIQRNLQSSILCTNAGR